jgi:post-segregation antitoxin (ccd killing protein)
MPRLYDRRAPKRAANLSGNKIAAAKREQWKKENADAIAAYNEFVEQYGVYSDGSRSF